MKKKSSKKNSGFPITNVGNDRRGSFVGNDRRSFVGNNRRGSFHMGERDADDVRDENHEATGFFPANGHNPAGPLPVTPAGAPPCHACRPLSVIPAGPSLSYLPAPLSYPPALLCHTCRPLCHTRRPFSVIPAGPSVIPAGSSLSCLPALLYHARRSPSVIPAVFSGNPELNL